MSEQEQFLATGRFVHEHGAAKRKLAAMQTELERYSKALRDLAGCLDKNIGDEFNLTTAKRELDKPPLAGMDFGKLLMFLEEYTELRKTVTAGKSRLRELGVDAV